MTEEYDEDSPLSRPPQHTSSSNKSPAHSSRDTLSTSDSTHNHQGEDGDGSPPASTPDPITSLTESTIDTTVAELQSYKQSPSQPKSSSRTGRHQIASDSPPPNSIAEGIEVTNQPDDDRPESTEVMDAVHQKPGVKRMLDDKGHKAPSKGSSKQGGLPHPERQTRQEAEVEGGAGSAPQGQTEGKQEKPWWQSAADSAVDGFEGAKSAFWGQVESFTKGQGDKQTPGERPHRSSCLCFLPA